MDRIELLRFLQEDVGEGELKTICFKLQVDYESLAAVGKADKALQLVEHLERRERLAELEGELAQLGVVGDGVPLALRPYLELTARRYGRLPLGPLDPSGQESSR
ncbi:MAG: hypothetical protein GY796_24820, partial [Chloroflexi bacterium]|nr:hypothetical protein [Chloroflexota bacterium]